MKKGYADIPSGQIHYRFGGSGPSLLLLHKTSMSSDEYSEVSPDIFPVPFHRRNGYAGIW